MPKAVKTTATTPVKKEKGGEGRGGGRRGGVSSRSPIRASRGGGSGATREKANGSGRGQDRPVAELVAEFPKVPMSELRKHLPRGTRFENAPGSTGKKYRVVLPAGGGEYPEGATLEFGATGYPHFKDRVPKDLGGGLWPGERHEHGDERRRWRYWKRHRGIKLADGRVAADVPLTRAWFSAHFLW